MYHQDIKPSKLCAIHLLQQNHIPSRHQTQQALCNSSITTEPYTIKTSNPASFVQFIYYNITIYHQDIKPSKLCAIHLLQQNHIPSMHQTQQALCTSSITTEPCTIKTSNPASFVQFIYYNRTIYRQDIKPSKLCAIHLLQQNHIPSIHQTQQALCTSSITTEPCTIKTSNPASFVQFIYYNRTIYHQDIKPSKLCALHLLQQNHIPSRHQTQQALCTSSIATEPYTFKTSSPASFVQFIYYNGAIYHQDIKPSKLCAWM